MSPCLIVQESKIVSEKVGLRPCRRGGVRLQVETPQGHPTKMVGITLNRVVHPTYENQPNLPNFYMMKLFFYLSTQNSINLICYCNITRVQGIEEKLLHVQED